MFKNFLTAAIFMILLSGFLYFTEGISGKEKKPEPQVKVAMIDGCRVHSAAAGEPALNITSPPARKESALENAFKNAISQAMRFCNHPVESEKRQKEVYKILRDATNPQMIDYDSNGNCSVIVHIDWCELSRKMPTESGGKYRCQPDKTQ